MLTATDLISANKSARNAIIATFPNEPTEEQLKHIHASACVPTTSDDGSFPVKVVLRKLKQLHWYKEALDHSIDTIVLALTNDKFFYRYVRQRGKQDTYLEATEVLEAMLSLGTGFHGTVLSRIIDKLYAHYAGEFPKFMHYVKGSDLPPAPTAEPHAELRKQHLADPSLVIECYNEELGCWYITKRPTWGAEKEYRFEPTPTSTQPTQPKGIIMGSLPKDSTMGFLNVTTYNNTDIKTLTEEQLIAAIRAEKAVIEALADIMESTKIQARVKEATKNVERLVKILDSRKDK